MYILRILFGMLSMQSFVSVVEVGTLCRVSGMLNMH